MTIDELTAHVGEEPKHLPSDEWRDESFHFREHGIIARLYDPEADRIYELEIGDGHGHDVTLDGMRVLGEQAQDVVRQLSVAGHVVRRDPSDASVFEGGGWRFWAPGDKVESVLVLNNPPCSEAAAASH